MSLSKMLEDYRNKKREFPTYEELAAIASSDQCADPIVERNVSLLRQRSAIGVEKYGTTLADNKLPLRAWLNHALEEALDQANYLQAAMAEIDSAAHQVESGTAITDTNLVDLCAFMNAASISNIPIWLSAQSAGALVKAMTTSAPGRAQEPIGFVNARVGAFIPSAAFAHTERNTELLTSGEVVKVYQEKMLPRTITKENAAQYLEELMWCFIETSGNFPSISIDPRTWEHALCYAPAQLVAVPDGKYGRLTGDNIAQPVQMKVETK